VQTNLAVFDVFIARCAPPERRAAYFHAAAAALNSLSDIPRRNMSRQEHSRIVGIALNNDITQGFSSLMDEGSREALCGGPVATTQTNVQPIDYTRIVHLIDRIPKRLPPEKDHGPIHEVVDSLSWFHSVTAAHSDLSSRFLVSRHLVQLIHLYLPSDPHPRQLFLAEGRAQMDMAVAAFRAQALPDDQQKQFLRAIAESPDRATTQSLIDIFHSSLASAVVAFENAVATSPMAPPLEPSSAMEPQVMLGDAYYADGDEQRAKNAYADAIRIEFAEEGEPPDELLWLAKAAARWTVILSNEGACKTSSPRFPDWDNVWIPLGAAPDHDLCGLRQFIPPSAAELDKFGVMGLVFPLIAESMRQCANPDPAGAAIDSERMKLLDCLRSTGPDAYVWAPPQLTAMSSEDADRAIANFLSRSPTH